MVILCEAALCVKLSSLVFSQIFDLSAAIFAEEGLHGFLTHPHVASQLSRPGVGKGFVYIPRVYAAFHARAVRVSGFNQFIAQHRARYARVRAARAGNDVQAIIIPIPAFQHFKHEVPAENGWGVEQLSAARDEIQRGGKQHVCV